MEGGGSGELDVIQVEKLTKRYGSLLAVEGLSFHVKKGEVVGFLGPNGAGKSTTLRMLTGYLRPSSGSIKIDGIDAIESPIEARRRFGYLPEGCPLHPEMRVNEYLRFRAELKGVPGRMIGSSVQRSVEQAGLADVADRIVGQLSKGYRQRVGIADALVADPPLLILDEPTSGLDPNQRAEVRELIQELASGDKTVLLSTHILPEVEATCGRVLILSKGKLVGQGGTEELADQMSAGASLMVLTVRGEQEKVRRILGGVEGIDRVLAVEVLEGEGKDAVLSVRAEVKQDPRISENVTIALAKEGLGVREIRLEEASLEDIFKSLTRTSAKKAEAAREGDAEGSAGGGLDDDPYEEGDGSRALEGSEEEE